MLPLVPAEDVTVYSGTVSTKSSHTAETLPVSPADPSVNVSVQVPLTCAADNGVKKLGTEVDAQLNVVKDWYPPLGITALLAAAVQNGADWPLPK